MSVEERRRIRLFERWVETWGQEDAEAMLELFPPPGRDVATSDDIAALDTRIETTRTELQLKIETARTELELKIEAATAQLTAVFRAEIQRALVTQTGITVFSMVTAFAAVSALALGLG